MNLCSDYTSKDEQTKLKAMIYLMLATGSFLFLKGVQRAVSSLGQSTCLSIFFKCCLNLQHHINDVLIANSDPFLYMAVQLIYK